MDPGQTEFPDFEAFWRHFVSSHRDPTVRWCHVAGLAGGLLGLAVALRRGRLWPLMPGLGAFVGLAILSHPVVTGRWPENFGHPAWAVRAFLRLCTRTVTGRIYEDL